MRQTEKSLGKMVSEGHGGNTGRGLFPPRVLFHPQRAVLLNSFVVNKAVLSIPKELGPVN